MADFKEFPKWLYNSDGLGVIANNQEEQEEQEAKGFHPVGWQAEQAEKKSKTK